MIYGSDICPESELSKGFTKPIDNEPVNQLPDDLRNEQEKLTAKRKLTKILRSKYVTEPYLSKGDMVNVFAKRPMDKRGKWLYDSSILSYVTLSGTVTIPGSHGHTIYVTVEDVRPAIIQDSLASMIQDRIGTLDDEFYYTIDRSVTIAT